MTIRFLQRSIAAARRVTEAGTLILGLGFVLTVSLSGTPAETQAQPAAPLISSDCRSPDKHKFISYLLIDPAAAAAADKTADWFRRIKDSIRPGERLIIAAGFGNEGSSELIFDLVRPQKTIWESPNKILEQQKFFDKCFQAGEDAARSKKPDRRVSPLLENLGRAAAVLQFDNSSVKRLIIISDMVQDSEHLSFYLDKRIDSAAALTKIEAHSLKFDFNGIEIIIAGAGSGVSTEKAEDLEHFWREYLRSAGGKLISYSPDIEI